MSANAYFVGGAVTPLDSNENKAKLVQRLRQYLEVRNLSVLIGNGTSIPLGAPLVGSCATIRSELDKPTFRLNDATEHASAIALLDGLLANGSDIAVEPMLAALVHIQANAKILGKAQDTTPNAVNAALLERLLKKWLYIRCRSLTNVADEDLRTHEELFRRLLLRSTILPRVRVFTTNYDLVLERALDNLGVMYFDGFLGTINRSLRTESYHYDLYYPGETTEGRVSRVDRVLHLYKLHGSINWRRRQRNGADDIVSSNEEPADNGYGDVMIYPSPLKVTEMNGYPYAEMFRHFSNSLHQPQSALLTLGYGFQDDHINRLIYQALSIPSFTVVITTPAITAPADPSKLESMHEVWRLVNQVKSNRVVVITGGEKDDNGRYISGAGTLNEFASTWLPDIRELNVEASAREETRKALAPLTPINDDK